RGIYAWLRSRRRWARLRSRRRCARSHDYLRSRSVGGACFPKPDSVATSGAEPAARDQWSVGAQPLWRCDVAAAADRPVSCREMLATQRPGVMPGRRRRESSLCRPRALFAAALMSPTKSFPSAARGSTFRCVALLKTGVERTPAYMSNPRKRGVVRRLQYGALPYRLRRGSRAQFMLITSHETRRWVIPKGWPKNGKSPQYSAAREALEEAGIVGA